MTGANAKNNMLGRSTSIDMTGAMAMGNTPGGGLNAADIANALMGHTPNGSNPNGSLNVGSLGNGGLGDLGMQFGRAGSIDNTGRLNSIDFGAYVSAIGGPVGPKFSMDMSHAQSSVLTGGVGRMDRMNSIDMNAPSAMAFGSSMGAAGNGMGRPAVTSFDITNPNLAGNMSNFLPSAQNSSSSSGFATNAQSSATTNGANANGTLSHQNSHQNSHNLMPSLSTTSSLGLGGLAAQLN